MFDQIFSSVSADMISFVERSRRISMEEVGGLIASCCLDQYHLYVQYDVVLKVDDHITIMSPTTSSASMICTSLSDTIHVKHISWLVIFV